MIIIRFIIFLLKIR